MTDRQQRPPCSSLREHPSSGPEGLTDAMESILAGRVEPRGLGRLRKLLHFLASLERIHEVQEVLDDLPEDSGQGGADPLERQPGVPEGS